MPIPYRPPNLHPPPDDLEGVGCRLRDQARETAGEEFGPVAQDGGRGGGFGVGVRAGGIGCQERVAEVVAGGVVGEEGHAGVGEHAGQGDGEAAVKVYEAALGGRDLGDGVRDGSCQGRGRYGGVGFRDGVGVFVVDLAADAGQGAPGIVFGLKGQAYADDFERVGEEDARDTGEGAGYEAAEGGFVLSRGNDDGAVLLVGDELGGGVGEDAEEGGRMSAEEPTNAILTVDVAHSGHDTEP